MDCPQQRFQTVNEIDQYARQQNITYISGLYISNVASICAMSSKLMCVICRWSTIMHIFKQIIILNGDVDFKCSSGFQTLMHLTTSLTNIYYDIRFFLKKNTMHSSAYTLLCTSIPYWYYKSECIRLPSYVMQPNTDTRRKMCLYRHAKLRHRFITTFKRKALCNYRLHALQYYIMIILISRKSTGLEKI